MIIKWTNKFSGETGYVKQVKTKEKCFENTFNRGEAKEYHSYAAARGIVTKLISYGEGKNNTFDVVS